MRQVRPGLSPRRIRAKVYPVDTARREPRTPSSRPNPSKNFAGLSSPCRLRRGLYRLRSLRRGLPVKSKSEAKHRAINMVPEPSDSRAKRRTTILPIPSRDFPATTFADSGKGRATRPSLSSNTPAPAPAAAKPLTSGSSPSFTATARSSPTLPAAVPYTAAICAPHPTPSRRMAGAPPGPIRSSKTARSSPWHESLDDQNRGYAGELLVRQTAKQPKNRLKLSSPRSKRPRGHCGEARASAIQRNGAGISI